MWQFSHLASRLRRFMSARNAAITASPSLAPHQPVNAWERLERFIVSETLVHEPDASARELAHENARSAVPLVGQCGPRVVNRVLELHETGRAIEREPSLFLLGLASAIGDDETKAAASHAILRLGDRGWADGRPGGGADGRRTGGPAERQTGGEPVGRQAVGGRR